ETRLGDGGAGDAAEEGVRRRRRKPEPPRDEVPDDGAHEPRADERQREHLGVDALRDALRHGCAEDQEGGEIEDGGPDDGGARRKHARGHDGGYGVCSVVESVDEVEDEREKDDGDECGHQAYSKTTPSRTLATSSHRSVALSRLS